MTKTRSVWIDRLRDEADQLADRLEELSGFIWSDEFRTIPARQRTLLTMQQAYMKAYLEVLEQRLQLDQKDESK